MQLNLVSEQELQGLKDRIKVLEALLTGVERVIASDGTLGFYIPGRVGINTRWWLTQPAGKGIALAVSTGVDNICTLIQHDGAEGTDGLGRNVPTDRVALKVVNTDPNVVGTNRGIVVLATNASHGNTAIDARAQYSPDADDKLTIITETEWKN